MTETKKHRLITRSDMDGLVCAALLRDLGMIEEIYFAHPKDMQDGLVAVTNNDIIANLPYVEDCYLAFDHHISEVDRLGAIPDNFIIDPAAASCADVIYKHYGGAERFPNISEDLMVAVSRADSAQYSQKEILRPTGWSLLNFVMDPRTGLGRFHNFSISNKDLMLKLAEALRDKTLEEILAMSDVRERIRVYNQQAPRFLAQIRRCSKIYRNLVVLDMLNESVQFAGNRFMIYAVYPRVNISMHMMWGPKKEKIVFAVGKSIVNRTSRTNIGELMLLYGGGGHNAAGTCQIPVEDFERVKGELIERITRDG